MSLNEGSASVVSLLCMASSIFKVVQFNVLGRNFALAKFFPHAKHYIREEKEELDWESRARKLQATIGKLDADIYCLCEVDVPEMVLAELTTYDFVYKQRPKRSDGCLIMWRSLRFSLVSQTHMQFPTTDRIALVVELKEISTQKHFRVISTHLYWDKTSALQVKEAQLLQAFISDCQTQSRMPTMILGDLNNSRTSETLRTLCVGGNMKDVFTASSLPLPEFTSLVPGVSGRKEEIDFILISDKDFGVADAGVLIEGDLSDGIPNEFHGSDHLPVYANVFLTNSSLD